MSCQPPHWARHSVSPSSQQRPVRATVPVSLMKQNQDSPIKSSNKSDHPPTYSTAKDLDDERLKCQDAIEKPTIFLGPRGEKSKTLNMRTQPQQHYIRRTASMDAIYVAGQLQPDQAIVVGFCRRFMIDKTTQTVEDYHETELRKATWKPIATSGEQLEVKYIRQKLQRTNQNSRGTGGLFCSQRQSPVQADHSAISVSTSGTTFHTSPTSFGILHKSIHPTSGHTSGPIPIARPPKLGSPRLQNSVEGLNQEIERLVLKHHSAIDIDAEYNRILEPTPEGHRAPIAMLFHSNQSSPCLAGQDSRASSGTASRSHSISPAVPIIPGNHDLSISPHSDETESIHKLGSSPRINQFFAREPPDGCERVKIMEESRRLPPADLSSGISNLPKPRVTYVLLPSQSSAFCPLYKSEVKSPSSGRYDSYSVVSTQTTPNCHK